MISYGREKHIKLVCSDVNVQNQATLEVTVASVRIDVDVASSLVLVVVSSVEMSIRVHRTPLWRSVGSSFHREGAAYLKERFVIFKEEWVGGRARVTIDKERVL